MIAVVTAVVLALATLVLVAIIAFFLFSLALKVIAEHMVAQNETHKQLPENCDESSDDQNCAAFQIKVNKS